MPMDKQLALALEFDNAPETVKVAAQQYRTDWLRLEIAQDQMKKWTREFEKAQKAHAKSAKDFKQAVEAWDPAGTKSNTLTQLP